MHTLSCVKCGEKAVSWSGHVKHGNRRIMAGWCSDECIEKAPYYGGGFYGKFRASMGVKGRGRKATLTACSCGESCPVWAYDHSPNKPPRGT